MPNDELFDRRALHALRELTGRVDAQFHDGQLEAIRAIALERRRVLVVQRTGWGKSAVYFIATRLMREAGAGPTLLVSPLLALMRNQVEAARRGGVRAEALNSANTADWDGILERLERDEIDLLLISEQRLKNDRFRDQYLPMIGQRSGLLVVDEVHCISDWGHDFRPWYRRISQFVGLLPATVPVLGCTATANDRVVGDIEQQLGADLLTIRGPLERSGLSLQVLPMPIQADRLAWLAQFIPTFAGSGIVYCLTVRDTEMVSGFLRSQGIDARQYSGSDEAAYRESVEEALLANKVKVVVATSALGMGFDKPDLAFVVHFQMPGSPIAYYQQVGRAGRQLEQSWGFGLVGAEDEDIQDWFISNAFPPVEAADAVIGALASVDGGLTLNGIESRVNIRHGRLESMLAQLEVEGVVERKGGQWFRTLRSWSYPQARVEQVTATRRHEQEVMRRYSGATTCRAQILRRVLDDPGADVCGICDVCAEQAAREPLDPELQSAAARWLGKQHVPIDPRLQWPAGLHEPRGRIALDRRAEPGLALCTLSDPVWGRLVRTGKRDDHRFSDELVDAAAKMLRDRTDGPAPTWVTCVPSLRTGDLVPSFAQRLAASLGLPFQTAVDKVRDARPQDTQQNSVQQVANLWGAFEVADDIPSGPVLLVDDIVSSGWTLTVVAAALREAGCDAVVPVVLADAAGSGT